MKKIIFFAGVLILLSLVSFCQQQKSLPGEMAFTKDSLYTIPLQQLLGATTHLPASGKKLVVIALLSPECPLSKNYSKKLVAIKDKYQAAANFIAIIPGSFDVEDIVEFKKKYLFNWTIFRDNTLRLTHYLQGEVTPEVIVINSGTGLLVYKGAIDNWAVSLGQTRARITNLYLENALEDFLNNRQVLITYSKPVGCFINDF